MTERAEPTRGGAGIPRVSVVIATFARGKLLLETLDSVFAQTARDVEVIVVNDGSPDDTARLLEPLVEAARIVYIEQTNHGVSHSRNVGLARARGEYVAILDDDDLWPADKLEWQVRFLDEHPDVGVVGGTLHTIDVAGTPGTPGPYYPSITFDSLFNGNPFWTPGQTLVRRSLIDRVGGMNTTIWGADDWDLWFRLARVSKIEMVERIALLYRLHDQNASKQTGKLLEGARRALESHLEIAEPGRRQQLRAAAHTTLYNVFASRIVRAAGLDLRAGRPRRAWSLIREVLPLLRAAGFERSMMAQLAVDLVRR